VDATETNSEFRDWTNAYRDFFFAARTADDSSKETTLHFNSAIAIGTRFLGHVVNRTEGDRHGFGIEIGAGANGA
jgi:hypothetical protein